ncbi:bifunctional metallophosphatase/5'-nucleotidase [Ectobacillus polymachus]|uniref:bifunctional metallophosphatase/5'-nucleotidase n=1 Tax=Ectobacillus polymachus TaxID=1508806 RepID=UPI003A84365A
MTIHLYHTNDLHSHFENWKPISQFFRKEKERLVNRGEDVFTLDIGDHVDRFHTITEATAGKANVQLLNEAKYDFATIGNNEGITLKKEDLDHLYDEAEFSVLVANLFYKDGTRPAWAKPYELRTLPSGITIACIGVTVAYPVFYSLLGWSITDPYEALEACMDEVREKADVVVLLSHLGRNEDEYIAEHYDIDVILGAHTHHFFEQGLLLHGTLLCCVGKWGRHVGHVQIGLNPVTKKIIRKKARTLATSKLHGYTDTGTMLLRLQEESEHIMNEQVVELKEDLVIDWFADSNFSKLLAVSLKEWCHADIGMVNAGIILDSLPKGIVTRGDIHRVCPHPINPCRLVVKGKTLREVILKAQRPQTEHIEVKGLGFRGKVMGKMIYEGVEIIPDTIPGNKRLLEEVLINGEPLELERLYSVGTVDMFTFGYLYPELLVAKEKHYFMPELLRDVLREKLIEVGHSVKS